MYPLCILVGGSRAYLNVILEDVSFKNSKLWALAPITVTIWLHVLGGMSWAGGPFLTPDKAVLGP